MEEPDIWWIALVGLLLFFWWQEKQHCACTQEDACPQTGAGV